MSSNAAPEHLDKDPENRLWSRFQPRRLEVEEIRDTLLALDSSIDLTVGGGLMEGEGTDKEFSDDRKSLHPDSTKRDWQVGDVRVLEVIRPLDKDIERTRAGLRSTFVLVGVVALALLGLSVATAVVGNRRRRAVRRPDAEGDAA